ncbi:hypothetical protein PV327_010966 [Microctonus hyperodae]|uniref:Uncharacterized protein n=1 Tax=Microctonus hyperodae TaxID=165561 RepID=A0AA39C881_MICHY|nr:hypothetical protein PV327_010966 [Microctonus hyperodae]
MCIPDTKENKKRKRNCKYQRAWRQSKQDLKKKDSKEEKTKKRREKRRVYYQRTKSLKANDKNVEELSQKKLDDLQIYHKPFVSVLEISDDDAGNDDGERVVEIMNEN